MIARPKERLIFSHCHIRTSGKRRDFFIYRLPNLTLLLDFECFALGWVGSYLREELKWPMAAGQGESL